MALKLMYLTNRPEIAAVAQWSGVDRIFVDLEQLGKTERQGHMDSVQSQHSLDDVSAIRNILDQSELLVRVNPIHSGSAEEINQVITRGADIIMLPMFTTKSEVEIFIKLVGGRARTMLLLETKAAYENIHEILTCSGIDEVHIGLNDLHLCYDLDFMFELVSNGVVEDICEILREKQISYGFGGIGRIGYGLLPAEQILCEHVRLGSGAVILARAFLDTTDGTDMSEEELLQHFSSGVNMLRNYERFYQSFDAVQFGYMHRAFYENTQAIANQIRRSVG